MDGDRHTKYDPRGKCPCPGILPRTAILIVLLFSGFESCFSLVLIVFTQQRGIKRPNHPAVHSGSYFVEHLQETKLDEDEHTKPPNPRRGSLVLSSVPEASTPSHDKSRNDALLPSPKAFASQHHPGPSQATHDVSRRISITTTSRPRTTTTPPQSKSSQHANGHSAASTSHRPPHRRAHSEGVHAHRTSSHPEASARLPRSPADIPLHRTETHTPRPDTSASRQIGNSSGKLVKSKPSSHPRNLAVRDPPPNKLRKLRRHSDTTLLANYLFVLLYSSPPLFYWV
ncbi:hypothetical protein HETIRDRAFT_436516 [Heterobasidion irregulare TC 32-1]|uniref:Uncharacterized protein n=1 Tax=Heterobasidion irregulare (strain TC 32-1) TaxID=747525 RepID=W4JSK1_HETIT|nr:uncharacterized protein HETIRDRAFT_436516 [Heterobasidion irregulare TC 32-1]ETW76523.1 hypothetical protein HETIRDRAFT_436516 [Heterobasidion irregulare TC 32-1]